MFNHVFLYFACRSGTEEEFTELHQLLEDISSYMKDLSAIRAVQATEKAALQKKIEEDKRKGEEMRRAAMEGISSELALLWSTFETYIPSFYGTQRRKQKYLHPRVLIIVHRDPLSLQQISTMSLKMMMMTQWSHQNRQEKIKVSSDLFSSIPGFMFYAI